MRRNKYSAVKVKADGLTFDSKKEHRAYCRLKIREKAGEIANLCVHPSFDLHGLDGKKVGKFTADFAFDDLCDNCYRIIDVKSEATAKARDFRLRKKLAEAEYNIEIEVWI